MPELPDVEAFRRYFNRDGWLVMHFGMTGFLKHYAPPDAAPPHTRMLINFTDGSRLAYDDQRMFGRIALIRDVDAFVAKRGLGPDPVEGALDSADFKVRVGKRRGAVKTVLLNQRVIAGIGNLYADEILFQARLHPAVRVDRLDDRSLRDSYGATRRVLTRAIRARADVGKLP